MQRTRPRTLALVAVAVALGGWLLLRALESRGIIPPPVPWLVAAVELVISGVVLAMGWAVRQYLHGDRPTLDPIRAARTAVLAKASCLTGAMLAGWYGAQVLVVLGDLDLGPQRERAIGAGAATAGALVLAVAGVIVEGWCRVPPPPAGDPAGGPRPRDPEADPAGG